MDYSIADRLTKLRRDHGYSQEGLAAELGLTRQAVSRWERGESLPDTENLIALADLYSVSLDELVRPGARDDQPQPEESEGPTGDDAPQDVQDEAVASEELPQCDADDSVDANPEPLDSLPNVTDDVEGQSLRDATVAGAMPQADAPAAAQRPYTYKKVAQDGPSRPQGFADAQAPEWQISSEQSDAGRAGVWAARILVGVLALVLVAALGTCGLARTFQAVYSGATVETDPRSEMISGTDSNGVSIDPAEVRSLRLNWASGTVRIVAEEDLSEVTVTEQYLDRSLVEYPMIVEVTPDGELSVDYGVPSGKSFFNSDGKRLTVCIPADLVNLDEIECAIASGKLECERVDCGTLQIQLASGDVDVSDVVARELMLQVGSGDARVEGEFSGHVSAAVQSGDSYLSSQVVPSSTDLKVTSGSIDYRLPEDASFTLRAKSTSGEVTVGYEATHEGDTYLVGGGGSTIDASVTSGDIKVRPL